MMLCEKGKESDVSKYHLKWIAQKKLDGVRCIAYCGSEITLIGRSGSNYTSKFPEIVNDLKGFNGVLDGEIMCETFDKTASRVHTENKLKSKLLVDEYPAVFNVFDILNDGKMDFKDDMLITRLKILQEIGFVGKKSVKVVDYTPDLIKLWETAKTENWEGIIIKNPKSKYEERRSFNWLKIKYIKSRDILVKSYEINPAGIRIEEGNIACQISGHNGQEVKKLIDETGSCLIEINYLNETTSGKLRMPVFKTIK